MQGPTNDSEGCQDAVMRGSLRESRAGEIGGGPAIADQARLLEVLQPGPGRRDQGP